MAAILRTFTEPTDVYISGDYYNDIKEAFSITDDESGVGITNGSKTVDINSYGFIYIFTKDEFRAAIPKIDYLDEDATYSNWEGVYLKDFVGDIKLILRAEESNEEFGIKKGDNILREDVDLTDYAWHQQSEKATKRTTRTYGEGKSYTQVECVVQSELYVILPDNAQMSECMDTIELIQLLKLSDKQ